MLKNSNSDSDALFEVGDTATYPERLLTFLNRDHLVSLTIQITTNKGWVVYSNIQGTSDHCCSYDYATKLGSLPDVFGTVRNLEALTISYLGIDGLPASLFDLIKLRSLDISFNKIKLSKERNKILALSNLKLLKIYGCNFSAEDLTLIHRLRPDLTVLYTEKHLMLELKENRN